MKHLVFFLFFIIILSVGFGVHYLFDKSLKGFEGYLLGVFISVTLWIIFHNRSKKLEFVEKNSKILNYLALAIAIIGALIWLMGEYLVWTGQDEHPILDPIGAFTTAIGAFMGLYLYIYHS